MKNARKAVHKATEARKMAARKTRVAMPAVKGAMDVANPIEGQNKRGHCLTPPPSFLYKYAPANLERIWDVLVNKRIYFSSPLDFNDPFDCRLVPDTSPGKRKEWRRLMDENSEWGKQFGIEPLRGKEREERIAALSAPQNNPDLLSGVIANAQRTWGDNVGVCCLAEECDNPAMWGHYASNHAGVCYEFDLRGHWQATMEDSALSFAPFNFLRPIVYRQTPPLLDPAKFRASIFEDPCFVKSPAWRHEKEWRAMTYSRNVFDMPTPHPEISRISGGKGAHPMNKGLLCGVILGCAMNPWFKRKIIVLAEACGVKIYQARMENEKYGLKIEPYRG